MKLKIYTHDLWWQAYTEIAILNNAKSVCQTQELESVKKSQINLMLPCGGL